MKNNTISVKDFVTTLRAFCLLNEGDIPTEELLLCIGADVLKITYDEMEKILNDT